MRQEINLYLPEFIPKKIWLSFNAIVAVWLLLVLLAGFTIVVDYIDYQKSIYLLEENKALSIALDDKLSRLQKSMPEGNHELVQKDIDALMLRINHKQQLLHIFTEKNIGNRQGFSTFLLGLSEYHVAGVSVTMFSIDDGGRYAAMSGVAEKAEYVPYYLQQLQKKTLFSTTQFGPLSIKKHKTHSTLVDFRFLNEGEYDG